MTTWANTETGELVQGDCPKDGLDCLVQDCGHDTPCWIWQRGGHSEGYGTTKVDGRTVYAHRLMYERHVGPIPAGLDLDHLCRNRICCNPAHLEPVTRRENVLRGMSPAAQQARQTHCLNGHELAGDNLAITKNGRRQCRACNKARCRARRLADQ